MKRAIFVVAMMLAAGGGVGAEKLDPAACDALRGEQAGLVAAGVRRDMERGPEWARANLGRDRLQQIAKLMSVEEQLIFRCTTLHPKPAHATDTASPSQPKVRTKQVTAADGDVAAEAKPKKKKAATVESKDGQSDEAPKPARKKSKPAAESTEAPPPATGTATAATADGGDASKPRKTARKATKADDAFVPPASGKE